MTMGHVQCDAVVLSGSGYKGDWSSSPIVDRGECARSRRRDRESLRVSLDLFHVQPIGSQNESLPHACGEEC